MALILSLFRRRADLESALDELGASNLAERAAVAAQESTARALIVEGERESKDVSFGTKLGTAAGVAGGLVLGILSLPLVGVPVLLLAALAGGGLGAAGGAAAGAATAGIGVGQDEAVMLESVREGDYLLAVEVLEGRESDITALLHRHGGELQSARPGRLPEGITELERRAQS
ncbi:MAG: hypothetical protein SFU83_02125 [Meiothermus sp.]|nr:hypothetical protein [Meiothermus sp.]